MGTVTLLFVVLLTQASHKMTRSNLLLALTDGLALREGDTMGRDKNK